MNLNELRQNFLSRYYFDTPVVVAVLEVTFHKGQPQYRLIHTQDLGEPFEHLHPDDFLEEQIAMSSILYDTGNFTTIEWLNADETDVAVSTLDDAFTAEFPDLKFGDDDEVEAKYPYARQIAQYASFNARIYFVQITELDGEVEHAGFIIKHSNPKISTLIKLGNAA